MPTRFEHATYLTPPQVLGGDATGSVQRVVSISSARAVASEEHNHTFVVVSPTLELLATAREAIVSLLDARDFLGLQLSNAQGAVSDERLDELAEQYLRLHAWEPDELALRVRHLQALIGERADADVVSTTMRCSVRQAIAALTAPERPTVSESLLPPSSSP